MNIVYGICLLIGFGGLFLYFYLKNIEVDNELEELYDMYYELVNKSPETKNKGKITVLNRKEV